MRRWRGVVVAGGMAGLLASASVAVADTTFHLREDGSYRVERVLASGGRVWLEAEAREVVLRDGRGKRVVVVVVGEELRGMGDWEQREFLGRAKVVHRLLRHEPLYWGRDLRWVVRDGERGSGCEGDCE